MFYLIFFKKKRYNKIKIYFRFENAELFFFFAVKKNGCSIRSENEIYIAICQIKNKKLFINLFFIFFK